MEFRKMRRAKQELTKEQAEKILKEGQTAVLGVIGDNGYPYTVPLNYVYDGGKVYFHCAKEGHKIDAIRKNDKVSLTVIEHDQIVPEEFTDYFRSVILFGRARILESDSEIREAAKKLGLKYYNAPKAVEEEIDKFWKTLACVEIEIDHITGKEAIELVNMRKNK